MKYKNFLLRAVNLLLILGILWQYQQVALVRAAAVSQRKQEIAEVEAYNASVLQAQSAAQAEQTQSGYRDGTYEGSAFGFGDVIRVSVTIRNGKMTDISVLDASGEDKPYYKQALPLLDEMLAVQSAEVDTVSGATLTAEGQISAAGRAGGAVCDPAGKAADRRKPVGGIFPPDGTASAAGGLRRRHCAACAYFAGHGSAAPVLLSVPLPHGGGVRPAAGAALCTAAPAERELHPGLQCL